MVWSLNPVWKRNETSEGRDVKLLLIPDAVNHLHLLRVCESSMTSEKERSTTWLLGTCSAGRAVKNDTLVTPTFREIKSFSATFINFPLEASDDTHSCYNVYQDLTLIYLSSTRLYFHFYSVFMVKQTNAEILHNKPSIITQTNKKINKSIKRTWPGTDKRVKTFSLIHYIQVKIFAYI